MLLIALWLRLALHLALDAIVAAALTALFLPVWAIANGSIDPLDWDQLPIAGLLPMWLTIWLILILYALTTGDPPPPTGRGPLAEGTAQ